MSKKVTMNDLQREMASMEEANKMRNDSILAALKSFFGFSKRASDIHLSALKAHDDKSNKRSDIQLHAIKSLNVKSEERTKRIIGEVRKNANNRKKSIGLLILVLIVGALLAYVSYWFVIDSNLCRLGGLWREIVQRDSWGNIIPGSYTYELVEGAKVIWGALSVAIGSAVAVLLHAVIPWYRREEV